MLLPLLIGAAVLLYLRPVSADEPLALATVNAQACHNEGAQDVKTYLCDGNFSGGLCASGFYRNVAFSRSYAIPPKVIVTARNISDQGGCVGGATDKVVCKAENITTAGFRLTCFGSPESGSCGDKNGWTTYASADWLALEDSPQCRTMGANNLSPTVCTGKSAGGLCNKPFMQRVTFEKPFATVPHVLTAAENLSDQGGCVGGSTDKVACNPENVTTTGFDLLCSGSPASSCGDKEGWRSLAKAGFIAKESTDFCKVESGHGIESDHCPGSQVGNVCSKAFEKRIVFTKLYSSPPQVIVSAEDITSAGTPCAQGATDKVICFAKDVTTIGFTAVCSGSPEGGHAAYTVQNPSNWACIPKDRSHHDRLFHKNKGCDWVATPQPPTTVPATQCGEYEGWNTKAKFGYLVVDNQCSGGQVSSSSSSSTSSVSTSSSSLSSTSSSAVSSSSSSSINNCIYYPWLCSSSSSSSIQSSSSISSSSSVSSASSSSNSVPYCVLYPHLCSSSSSSMSSSSTLSSSSSMNSSVSSATYCQIYPQYCISSSSSSSSSSSVSTCGWSCPGSSSSALSLSTSISSSVSSATYCQIYPQYCSSASSVSSSSSVSSMIAYCPNGQIAPKGEIVAEKFTISCAPANGSQLCRNDFIKQFTVPSTQAVTALLKVREPSENMFFQRASTGNCSAVRVHTYLDGQLVGTTPFLGWAAGNGHGGDPQNRTLTGSLFQGLTLSPGQHTIALRAEGQTGGCNIGTLEKWSGNLKIEQLMCPSSSSSTSSVSTSSSAASCGGFWGCYWPWGGTQNANVNANANTTVNNQINAGSQNQTNVWQSGTGNQNANIDANANTTVNNQINAGSTNQTWVNQTGWW